jgi:tetratricopeptide (TPR) repeat protein
MVLLLAFYLASIQTEKRNLDRLYRMAQFSQIVDHLKDSPFDKLPDKEKLLYVECLARTSQRNEAERLLEKLLSDPTSISQVQATSGIVYLSLGQLERAEDHIQQALSQDPDCAKAKLTKMMLLLYLQNYQEAQELYKEFNRKYQDWAETYLFYLIGIEIYGATRNISKIGELYKNQAARLKGQDKEQYENFRKNSRLYKKPPQKRFFEFANASDKVELPFSEPLDKTHSPILSLKTEDRPFTIILDTGNRVGWMIHSRELNRRLKSKTGGMGLAQIGAEEGLLHGQHIFTERLEFGYLSLRNLAGMYVPKLHPGYPDANLNPLFIKDRVITLDFIKEVLILRSEERFQNDLDSISARSSRPLILPWYGYKEAFVPVTINGNWKALAILETGAEDITLSLDFAKSHQMPLEPAVRYIASGKQFLFHRTPLTLYLGPLMFERPAAEVWALGQLTDPITGFAPDVIVGPDFFKKRWTISFDSFEHRVILSNYSH